MGVAEERVAEARRLLAAHLPVTRLVPAGSLRAGGVEVWLKLESELPTGSFKPRGALYALWARQQAGPVPEVITCSTGNHGAAVAYASRLFGVRATIFLPERANPAKRGRIAALGARICEGGEDLAAAMQRASQYAAESGAYFLDDATAPDVPLGPATIACEIFEQEPSVDCIVAPMGDTALIRGIGAEARRRRPGIRIVGVQAERAPSYYLSWRSGDPVATDRCDTIADGLATRTPNGDNVRAIRQLVDEVQLVSEEEMLRAMRHLLLEEHVVAEPAGAAATAAFLQRRDEFHGRRVALIVSGANVTADVVRAALGG
jgi:threonine dehydratase